ncbi:MAG TPA: hypothetical protein VG965_05050 [Patescibacteria group bacterium]|nr:hypothetical protein [Patescibacteria group bacterium]
MITVPEATKKIIERSRYLSEAISKGIINYSSLARYIKPEIEEMLLKKVSQASIVMALNRLEPDFQPKYKTSNLFKVAPEISVRSGFTLVTLNKNEDRGLSLLLSQEMDSGSLYFRNEGRRETTLILSQDLYEKYKETIDGKRPILLQHKVSAVTIYLPPNTIKTPGIYYFFLKSLAWDGINILEVITNPHEFILIVEDHDTGRTFNILKGLFN